MEKPQIEIRECATPEQLHECVEIQRRAFSSSDLEVSPARHLIVTRSAGGWTLGAYDRDRLVGFVLSVPMFRGNEKALYSHMTGVDPDYQNFGIGARLKWAQRERAISEGIRFIKWTFQPVLPRNAFFNLERLGATIGHYAPNFYGTDCDMNLEPGEVRGVPSDRLFCEWELESPKVVALAKGDVWTETSEVKKRIVIPADWKTLLREDTAAAIAEQARIKEEFLGAFSQGLVAKGFERSETEPSYLLYEK